MYWLLLPLACCGLFLLLATYCYHVENVQTLGWLALLCCWRLYCLSRQPPP